MTFRAPSPFRLRGPSPALRPPASGLPSPVSRRSAAFTLVELLIGASLSAAVLAAVLSSYTYLGRQLARLAHQQTLETQARLAIGTLTRDVQTATGLVTVSAAPASPAANRVDLTVPTATGTVPTVTYYYNNGTAATDVTINGNTVSMPAQSLTRCETIAATSTLVSTRTLLRHISDGDAGTTSDLAFRYYDASGNEYETATLTAGSYLPGIRQVSLEFSAQVVTVNQGTTTPVQREATSRLALRNRPFLQ